MKRVQKSKKLLRLKAGSPINANVLTNPPAIKGKLLQFLWKMKTENYSETIQCYGRALETLAKRGADLNNPESVKQTITIQKWSNGTKQNATNAILRCYKYKGITAQLPTYKPLDKIPFIPTENEIDQLTNATKHQLATFLQTLKETAARYGKALNLKWTDFNTETATLAITPEKGSNPRAPKSASNYKQC